MQVLYLEQLLTTGGGWQDQCGGLYGGAKISESHKGLPVNITTRQLQMPPGFTDTLNKHLILVYTGKTRLARNLLQVIGPRVTRVTCRGRDRVVCGLGCVAQLALKAAKDCAEHAGSGGQCSTSSCCRGERCAQYCKVVV